MNRDGNSWAEGSPFDPDGFYISPKTSIEEEEGEEIEPLDKENLVKQGSIDDQKKPVEMDLRFNGPATKMTSEGSVEKEEKIEKRPQKHVVINVPPEEESEEEEQKEEGKTVVRRYPTRSQTVNYGATPPLSVKNKDLRRQSLVMLRQGHTGEGGSRKFKAALRRDSIYEVHPGWESIKRLSKVVG